MDPDEAHRLLLWSRSSGQVTRQCGHGQDAGVGPAAASVPLRRVRPGELRCEEVLYEPKASLRAAAAGGRPRPAMASPDAPLLAASTATWQWAEVTPGFEPFPGRPGLAGGNLPEVAVRVAEVPEVAPARPLPPSRRRHRRPRPCPRPRPRLRSTGRCSGTRRPGTRSPRGRRRRPGPPPRVRRGPVTTILHRG